MDQWRIFVELQAIIICLLAFFVLFITTQIHKRVKGTLTSQLFVVMIILLADIVTTKYMGNITLIGKTLVSLSTVIMFIFLQLCILIMANYLVAKFEEYDPTMENQWIKIIYVIQGCLIVACVINTSFGKIYYFDDHNYFHAGPFFTTFIILSLLSIGIQWVKVVQYGKHLKKLDGLAMRCYVTLPIIGYVLQMFYKEFCFVHVCMTIAIIVVVGIYSYQNYYLEKEKDKILAQSRAYLLNSQIKPHFLFNSLNVIQSLVEDEPEVAKKAIGHLSKFLRKNLDLKLSEKPVSIWEELDFTQNYLYMEKLRFGDKLNIRYEVDDEVEFPIPFLSLQTIVENAVRHGIRKKMEGGTVLIRIYEEMNTYRTQIIDDGIGFDPDHPDTTKKEKKDSNGVGMNNVKERLKLLCNGTMRVESEPGKGTRVTIIIPKG